VKKKKTAPRRAETQTTKKQLTQKIVMSFGDDLEAMEALAKVLERISERHRRRPRRA